MGDAPAPAARPARSAPVRLAPLRTEWLQIRLSPQEKAQLAALGRSAGYQTLSDFVRARTLGGQQAHAREQ